MRFEKLLEPGRIGSLELRNRIVKMGSTIGFYPWQDGHIQKEVIDIYENLAKGGVALVTAGAAPFGVPPGRGYLMDDDKYLPDMARLAEAIRRHGAVAFVQMFHIGPMLPPFLRSEKVYPVAASALSKEELPLPHLLPPKELTVEEIKRIVEDFVALAVRAKKAGFQGVEINAACNHLLNSFLSRAWNRRRDQYGSETIENRSRIVTEIIEGIRRENGKEFGIVVNINGAEIGLKDGITPEESLQIAQVLERAGADAINVRAEFYMVAKDPSRTDSTHFPDLALYPEPTISVKGLMEDRFYGRAGWVPLAANIKKGISIPVIAAGRLDPEFGEKVLRQGAADFIYLNRALMADPELPKKLMEGRAEDVRPCLGCLACFDNNEKGNPALCFVNPTLGRERAFEAIRSTKRKRVVVLGAGPGGLEAARIAALKGHEVILLEKAPRLGGSMLLAAIVKGLKKENHLGLLRYYETQLRKLGVKVRLGVEAKPSTVKDLSPDVLILAAGGVHNVPSIPGIRSKKVLTSKDLHNLLWKLLRWLPPEALLYGSMVWMPVGKKVAIIGGQIQGCQLAEFLVKRGREVALVEEGSEIGKGLFEVLVKPKLLDWLERKGVKLYPGAKPLEVTDTGLVILDKEGNRRLLEAETVITALPMLPNGHVVRLFEGIAPEVHAIGDCREPRLIGDAIREGFEVAFAL